MSTSELDSQFLLPTVLVVKFEYRMYSPKCNNIVTRYMYYNITY